MRQLTIGTEKYTKVFAVDEPEFNANHVYTVETADSRKKPLTTVTFQKGPIKEYDLNGCCNEDLIAMVIDRLESFQKSEFSCSENALAITKLEEALHWLRHRTNKRERAGIEGTSTI